jgi:hypothetical protein
MRAIRPICSHGPRPASDGSGNVTADNGIDGG